MSNPYELQGNFEQEVLQNSQETPVLVDFWAAWCGPCRILGPVLEKLADEADARWRLVKVDTEAHPELAMQYGIRSIPAVKLFAGGKVIDEFVGALPEAEIRRWLDAALPGDGGSTDPGAEDPLAEARGILRSDPSRARELLEGAAENGDAELREALLTLSRLLDIARRDARSELAQATGDATADYLAGANAFLAGDDESALREWIDVMARDRTLDDDGARRATIAAFRLLGEDDPLTQSYRRKFSAALF